MRSHKTPGILIAANYATRAPVPRIFRSPGKHGEERGDWNVTWRNGSRPLRRNPADPIALPPGVYSSSWYSTTVPITQRILSHVRLHLTAFVALPSYHRCCDKRTINIGAVAAKGTQTTAPVSASAIYRLLNNLPRIGPPLSGMPIFVLLSRPFYRFIYFRLILSHRHVPPAPTGPPLCSPCMRLCTSARIPSSPPVPRFAFFVIPGACLFSRRFWQGEEGAVWRRFPGCGGKGAGATFAHRLVFARAAPDELPTLQS